MTTYERQRLLIDQALAHVADETVPTSRALDDCLRLAELRHDHLNLWWMRVESFGIEDKRELALLDAEMALVFAPPLWTQLREKTLRDHMERRRVLGENGEAMLSAEALREIETTVASLEGIADATKPVPGLHPLDLADAVAKHQTVMMQSAHGIRVRRVILGRIRTRLARYLAETESALEFAEAASGAFERVRAKVDGLLTQIAPDALAKFKAANERAATGDREAGSQALASCRRIFVSLADSLYPATDAIVKGADNVERVMSADKYRNRLWQFISDNVPHESSRRLMQASINEIGGRLDILDDLASKGVHSEVTAAEVDQCVVQTYMLAGDLLSLIRGHECGSF